MAAMRQGQVQGPGFRVALAEGFGGVGAGKEEPVVVVEVGEGGIERGEGGGLGEFDGGNEDGFEAGRAEGFGERRGLVRRASDEDTGHGSPLEQMQRKPRFPCLRIETLRQAQGRLWGTRLQLSGFFDFGAGCVVPPCGEQQLGVKPENILQDAAVLLLQGRALHDLDGGAL